MQFVLSDYRTFGGEGTGFSTNWKIFVLVSGQSVSISEFLNALRLSLSGSSRLRHLEEQN
jgi:hypothetical protein